MNRKLLILFLVVLNASAFKARAQATDAVNPDAGLLPGTGMQGNDVGRNYSVDLFTGIGNIHIPIYDFTPDGVNLSISLDYNTKGILVDQIASAEGLGFTLNAEPYIVRVTNDVEDEVSLHGGMAYPIQYRGMWIDSLNPVWNSESHQKYEHEYDVFKANLGGRNIDFILYRQPIYNSSLGRWMTVYKAVTSPKSDINITVTEGGMSTTGIDTNISVDETSHLLSFGITDEKGNVYQFQQGDYQWKSYHPYDTATFGYDYYPTQRWVAKNVTTASGAIINYSYKQYNVSYNQYKSDAVLESGTYNVNAVSSTTVGWGGVVSHISGISTSYGDTITFNLNDPNGIERLDLLNSDILHSITIKKGYDGNVQDSVKYILNYAYFNTPFATSYSVFTQKEVPYNTPTVTTYYDSLIAAGVATTDIMTAFTQGLRLKLKSIDKVGADNSATEQYFKFDYNPKNLPRRLDDSQDWFGYYNGKSSIAFMAGGYWEPDAVGPGVHYVGGSVYYSGVPQHTVSDPIHNYDVGIDKNSVDSCMQADMLVSITNSMGGKTDFTYWPQTLLPPVYNTHSLPTGILAMNARGAYDGLVVHQITYEDGFNLENTQYTEYLYSNGYTLYPGVFFWYPTALSNSAGSSFDQRLYVNKIVSPIDFFRGANHGYSTVQVQKLGRYGELLSYKIFKFSNVDNTDSSTSYLDDDKSYPAYITFPRQSFLKYKIGLPLSIQQFSNDSHPMSLTTYSYDTSSGIDAPASTKYVKYKITIASDKTFTRTYHPFETSVSRVKRTDIENYSGNDTSRRYSIFNYDVHDNLSSIQWDDSRGRTFLKKLLYTYSYAPSSYPGIMAFASSTQNLVTEEIQDISDSTNPKVVSFTQMSPNYNSYGYVIDSIAKSTLDSPVSVSVFHQSDTNNFNYNRFVSNITRFTVRDDHNNILESWNNKIYNSSIWDTRINKKLATVSNAQYRDIAYTSFEGPVTSLGTTDFNKGNWDYNPTYVAIGGSSLKPMTGKYYYTLNPVHSDDYVVSTNTLTSGKNYILSFWCKGNIPRVFQGVFPTWSAITLTQQIQVGDWSLYTSIVTGSNNTLTITGNGTAPPGGSLISNLDELRLYPVNSFMTTFCYEPLLGVISKCDSKNNITYFDYDAFGRNNVVRDIKGNILTFTRQTDQGTDY